MTITVANIEAKVNLDRILHAILVIGMTLSATAIGIGLLMSLWETPRASVAVATAPSSAAGIADIVNEFQRSPLAWRADTFLYLGMLLLVATPVVRVVGSLVDFLRLRDWRFVGISLLVLIMLTIGLFSGF